MVFKNALANKYVMGISGLFLVVFLIAHLSGNLLLFLDDNGQAFNAYAHFMSTNTFTRIAEIILALGFLTHIVMAIILNIKRLKVRPVPYKMNKGSENSSFMSRNMGITGSVILLFLVIHLKNFFVESRIYGEKDLYSLVKAAFQDPLYVGIYLFSLIVLALHLAHGFQSAFQSWGVSGRSYTTIIKKAGYIFSIVVPLGFAAMPLYFYLQNLF